MTKLTDETLMYYADGLLSASECEWVDKLLAANPDLRSRLEIFRATGRPLSNLLAEDDGVPAPQQLRDFVAGLQDPRGGGKAPPKGVKPSRNGRRGPSRPGDGASLSGREGAAPSNVRLMSTAFIALMTGAALGWMAREALPRPAHVADLVMKQGARIVARGPLHDALESVSSGGGARLAVSGGGEARLHMKSTFRNTAQNFCREYELTAGSSERYVSAACRIDGAWAVQFQALTPSSAPAIEAAISAMTAGAPLSREEEQAAMRQSWRE